jgi:arylformamidase
MTLIDISLSISPRLPIWPGDPPIELKKISQIKDGELANLTQLTSCVHIGTHVDAPDHFLDNGQTVENIPLDLMVGPVLVVELSSPETITKGDLIKARIPSGTKRILLKTNNSMLWAAENCDFQEDFIALDVQAADLLVKLGVRVIGVDYLSVAPFQDPAPTHRSLLRAGVLIIEGLDLSRVEPGDYTLLCLPIKIEGSDGAPARVLLQH